MLARVSPGPLTAGRSFAPAGAQAPVKVLAQLAPALDVEALVDRFVADLHALIVTEGLLQSQRHQLRGPAIIHGVLDVSGQVRVLKPESFGTPAPLMRTNLGHIGLICPVSAPA